MKKLLCVLLTAVMLLAMIPSFAVSAAETETPEYLTVTPVSQTDNYANNGTYAVNWNLAWNTANAIRLGVQFDEEIEFVGEFSEPSYIASFTIKAGKYAKVNGNFAVSFSNDLETWDERYVVENNIQNTTDGTLFTFDVNTNKAYKYVKVSKDLTVEHWAGWIGADLYWIGFVASDSEVNDVSAVKPVYAGAQAKSYTVAEGDNAGDYYDVRFLATLDETSLTNKKVVFDITAYYSGGTQSFEIDTDTVYTTVKADGDDYGASDFTAEHEYLAAVAVKGISKAKYENVVFDVKVSVTTVSDEKVIADNKGAVTFKDGEDVKGALVPVSFVSDSGNRHTNTAYAPAEAVWDTQDKTTHTIYTNTVGGYTVGALTTPTCITKITYYAPPASANRARLGVFEASVDGVNWVTLATLPNPIADSGVYEFDIVDGTAYKYIRLRKMQTGAEWLSIGTIAVEGISLEQAQN